MATIIVPAHNESTVIKDCLDSIVDQKGVDQVIVVCNGCTDDTVDIVRQNYPDVRCLDIEKPSKTNALNEAEKYILSYPVFYIDADTILSPNTVFHIAQALENSPIMLAAPTPDVDTSQSTWAVKQFYKIWLNLPYINDGVIGTCSFILTEKGRSRFDKFPDIINDDGFVRCCFDTHERANIPGCKINIRAPKNLYSLIKIKTRARLGNMQLNALKLCMKPKKANYSNAMKKKIFSKDVFSAVVYIGIVMVIRLRAYFQFQRLDHNYRWEKDLSTRKILK